MAAPVTASALLNEVFRRDLKQSVQKPEEGKEVVVKPGGKVSTFSTKKILKGNFAEFQKLTNMQNKTIASIMNAASIIAGNQTVEGGDEKLTKKIVKRFRKFKDPSEEIDDKEFAKELFNYANQLQQEHCNRRWLLDKQTGFEDNEALGEVGRKLSSQGISSLGWTSMIQDNFDELKGVNSTIQDIHRYGQNNRYHLFIGDDKEFPLPEYNGGKISVYLDELLQTFMVNLEMLGEGIEPTLSKHADSIRSQLQTYIRMEINRADKVSTDPIRNTRRAEMIPQSEVDNAGQDQVRDALKNLIQDLSLGKFSTNKEEELLEKKLGFLLFGMNQNWVVGPGIQFGRMAKECGSPGRFRETMMSAAVKLDDETRFDIHIVPNGSLRIEAKGTHTNYDHIKGDAEQDYLAEITTTLEFQPDSKPKVSFDLLMKIPERDTVITDEIATPNITNTETKALIEILKRTGFQPKVFPFVPEPPL